VPTVTRWVKWGANPNNSQKRTSDYVSYVSARQHYCHVFTSIAASNPLT